jgi:N-methylhydantoinase A
VALIRYAQPAVSGDIEIESAMPIHVPMVDVRTVGAGGGSIAHVNAAGLLEVGPESAGASPGPVCYGKGGTKPTIADANLLLGRLGTPSHAASDLKSEVETAIRTLLAKPLEMDTYAAAEAVIHVANTRMAGAIRMVSISLGVDPRDFALFAFGGAGPLHACALARELGVPRVLVPARPGITNALGCVVADLRHDYVRTVNRPVDTLDADEIHAVFAEQVARGEALINAEPIELTGINHLFSVDMQFIGQTHLLRVALDSATPTVDELQARFEQAYYKRFKVKLERIRANLVNVNTSVIGCRPPLDLSTLIDPAQRRTRVDDAKTATRKVMFDGAWHQTPVYWRDHLPLDISIAGPAIIEQMDTTILVEPGDVATGDQEGNIIIHIKGMHDA